MDPRLPTLLSWQLRFQSRRMSTWVMAAAYLLIVLLFLTLLPVPAAMAPGRLPFRVVQTLHGLAAVIFAIRLAAPSIDDNSSGALAFLKIANVDSSTWVRFRFVALLMAYLPIWIVRLPVYALVLSLGGVRLEEVLWLEAVQWVTFLTLGSLSLLVARYSATGSTLAVLTLVLAWLWQAVLYLPLMALAIIGLIQDRPSSWADHPWAVAVGQLALPRYFWRLPLDAGEFLIAVGGFALHLAIAVLLLRVLRRVVFFNVDADVATDDPVLRKGERKSTTRPSRRVSSDPLAWQACHVHSAVSLKSRIIAVLVASSCVSVLAFGVIEEPTPRSILLSVSCGLTLVILAFKPSDCLSRELKAKTLGTLALLPMDGREIYKAWLRGARDLARPAYAAVVLGGVVLTVISNAAAPYIWMVLAFTVLILPEAAFLSNITARRLSWIEFDFSQLVMTIWVIFLIAVMLAISLPVAIGINPWAGLAVFIGLAMVARALLSDEFIGAMAERVEREQ